eukprot:CFRG3845T1
MMEKFLNIAASVHKALYSIPYATRPLDLSLAWACTILRLGQGGHCAPGPPIKPDKSLILYEFEGCPFCKKVREHLCILDLDAIIKPCPRSTLKLHGYASESSRFRGEVVSKGGKAMFPYLIDENTGVAMYQSDAIVDYLWETYGKKKEKTLRIQIADAKIWRMPSLFLVSILRCLPRMGIMSTPSKRPEQLLELWSYEASPPCKLVRETLCTLEIPYLLRNSAGNSVKRPEFLEKYGHLVSGPRKAFNLIKVPLLIDPNTDTQLFESAEIVSYLNKTYKTGEMDPVDMGDYARAKKVYTTSKDAKMD